jgi:taurine dioxygenase
MTREQHIEFSRAFGDLDTHEVVPKDRHPLYHELLIVANKPVVPGQESDKAIGLSWHSDLVSSLRPALGSLLRAVQMPSAGGDTMFTNMYAAYETLSPAMQGMLEGLHAVYMRERKGGSAEWLTQHRQLNPPVAQPVVRVHPENGRKALYVGETARFFEGMTAAESRPLLEYLVKHATQPTFVYRHRWQTNDLLMWDNRCTMHLALGDYDRSKLRHMERTTLLGTPCGHVSEMPLEVVEGGTY